jgi:Domain of unknown function (DUF4157)
MRDRRVTGGDLVQRQARTTGAAPGKQTLVDQLQRAQTGAAGAADVHGVAAQGIAGGGGSLPHFAAIQASFGPQHDVSGIRAHVGGAAATAATGIGAQAYATGNNVAFRESPDLHTAAHEAAHVVQQQGGVQLSGGVGQDGDVHERHADAVADRVLRGAPSDDLLAHYAGGRGGASSAVQMRRLPPSVDALLTDPATAGKAPNFDAAAEGVLMLLSRTMQELTPAEVEKVRTEMLAGLTMAKFLTTLSADQILERANNAVLKVRPDLTLGDPKLIDIGARSGTDDTKNLKKLGHNAAKVFDKIASGHHKDLEQVFGKSHVGDARAKYAQGKKWMNKLLHLDKVVTDRSGYSEEVSLGGLTGFQEQIALAPDVIDKPDDPESIITMIHEAVHAGNSDVEDKGYIDQPSFTQLAADVKLTNAAHFEVVPRRILKATFAFDGQTFIPAGTTVGGVTAPDLTDAEKAIRGASETFRQAWTIGLNLHTQFDQVFKGPLQWTADQGGGTTFATGLPFWSKVEKLTIHKKTDIDPASGNPAKAPVSQIDMALSEGLVRRLALAMFAVPGNEADATAFEDAREKDATKRTEARKTVDKHRDFLIELVLQEPGVVPLTGDLKRDVRVVQELAKLNWADVLSKGGPGGFPD